MGDRASGVDAPVEGAGIWLLQSREITLTNNIVADNHLITGGVGPGLYMAGRPATLLHNTIAAMVEAMGAGEHQIDWGSNVLDAFPP